ncbi:hypothetical protein DSM19430T_16380 [Desulfovibrio psychrotolerans]|uniref:Uncharacterized protein n=1 Tax=Desulfovibrio psychrotolerans TaxID=415242 RepID=A0A7J0BVC3_9BACT|nr:hypothetical protein DSM19430T_16380 [Desulfovibrio psychrotolerans]
MPPGAGAQHGFSPPRLQPDMSACGIPSYGKLLAAKGMANAGILMPEQGSCADMRNGSLRYAGAV